MDKKKEVPLYLEILQTFAKKEKDTLIKTIMEKTKLANKDNITRTNAYLSYFKRNPEIRWAFLASMVSRNAGWNMTDLKSNWYRKMLSHSYRNILFMTYERANWLIFLDAYPQLLLYEASKRSKQPMFHLLKNFYVSNFMEQEWHYFWTNKNEERLCTALIINEQHLIQDPVIEHPYFAKEVFKTIPYYLVEHLHFNIVLFPTKTGELYGFSVKNFQDVVARVKLGKKLAWLLFELDNREELQTFGLEVEHTGSRNDYERFLAWQTSKQTPALRDVYPVIEHHRCDVHDWSKRKRDVSNLLEPVEKPIEAVHLTEWYQRKLAEIYVTMKIEELFLVVKGGDE